MTSWKKTGVSALALAVLLNWNVSSLALREEAVPVETADSGAVTETVTTPSDGGSAVLSDADTPSTTGETSGTEEPSGTENTFSTDAPSGTENTSSTEETSSTEDSGAVTETVTTPSDDGSAVLFDADAPSGNDDSSDDDSTDDDSTDDDSGTGNPPTEELSSAIWIPDTDDESKGDKSADDKSADDKSADDKSADDKSADDKSADDKSTKEDGELDPPLAKGLSRSVDSDGQNQEEYVVAPTGIMQDSAPFILLSCAGWAVLLLPHRRKSHQ